MKFELIKGWTPGAWTIKQGEDQYSVASWGRVAYGLYTSKEGNLIERLPWGQVGKGYTLCNDELRKQFVIARLKEINLEFFLWTQAHPVT